ncbi:MAG: hypothetical protein KGR26_06475 [Cyanobacteria bacterium REEB65]|nr:hypothetical protein [Cyanobacteria bacterium REEB65]
MLEAASALRPLKPDVAPEVPWPVLAVLPLVGLVVWVATRRPTLSRPDLPASQDPRSAIGPLRGRLEEIRRDGWIEKGKQLRACDRMADVLRDLLRSSFGIQSRRLTTAELLAEVSLRGGDEGLLRPLGDVLEACDLVKFAGISLPVSELRGHLETALILVNRQEAMSL